MDLLRIYRSKRENRRSQAASRNVGYAIWVFISQWPKFLHCESHAIPMLEVWGKVNSRSRPRWAYSPNFRALFGRPHVAALNCDR